MAHRGGRKGKLETRAAGYGCRWIRARKRARTRDIYYDLRSSPRIDLEMSRKTEARAELKNPGTARPRHAGFVTREAHAIIKGTQTFARRVIQTRPCSINQSAGGGPAAPKWERVPARAQVESSSTDQYLESCQSHLNNDYLSLSLPVSLCRASRVVDGDASHQQAFVRRPPGKNAHILSAPESI